MARRVGFGDSDRPPKKERQERKSEGRAAKGGVKGATRWIVGGFLAFWLTGWSAAIAFAVSEVIDQGPGGAETFLFVWVAIASVFWVLAVYMLWRVLTGRPISNGGRMNRGRAPGENGGLNRGDWDPGGDD